MPYGAQPIESPQTDDAATIENLQLEIKRLRRLIDLGALGLVGVAIVLALIDRSLYPLVFISCVVAAFVSALKHGP